MSRKHDWTFKVLEKNSYWIICKDCSAQAGTVTSEAEALQRILALKYQGSNPKLDRHFPKRRF